MATLDQLLDAGDERAERTRETGQQIQAATRVGFMWVGWALAKFVLAVMWLVAAPFWAVGFATSRWVIPAAKWSSAAFMVGWEAGRDGRRRRP
jgi:hypothetical protein